MKPARLINDSFLLGIISGAILLAIFFFMFSGLRHFLINYSGNSTVLKPPAVQMISIAANIVVFRFLMINLQKEKTGKGLLFITVLSALSYFYYYFRINPHS